MQNMKKPTDIPVFLFFHNIRPNLVQILSQISHTIYFVWLISNEICQLIIQLILKT